MRGFLNDFVSLIFGEKQYSTPELIAVFGFLTFIVCIMVFVGM